jgi:hypothetical protein
MLYIALLTDFPLVDIGSEVSPFNALAYGVLVTLLATIAYLQYQERVKVQSRYEDHIEKNVALLTLVESKLEVFNKLDEKLGKQELLFDRLTRVLEDFNERTR